MESIFNIKTTLCFGNHLGGSQVSNGQQRGFVQIFGGFHLHCKWNHGFSDSVHPDVSKNVSFSPSPEKFNESSFVNRRNLTTSGKAIYLIEAPMHSDSEARV